MRVLLIAVMAFAFAIEPAVNAGEELPRPVKDRKASKDVPGSEIFDRPTVLDFQIQLLETELQDLREHPREYTRATVLVNGVTYHDVGVKLKGNAGSFRPVDARPAMTLSFNKWSQGRRLYGLRRLHLTTRCRTTRA
jgi:spore coat protein CotH